MAARARTVRGTALLGVLALLSGLVGAITLEGTADAAVIPGPPISVVARGGNAPGTMTLSWAKPTNVKPGAKLNYLISASTDLGAFGPAVLVGSVSTRIMTCAGVNSCRYRVYARNKAGTGSASAIATGTWTRPAAPTITGGVGGPTVGSMKLTWAAPVNTGGKAINGYLYEVQVNSAGAWLGPFSIAGVPLTAQVPCPSTSPTGGCSYRIYARNVKGTSVASTALKVSWALPTAPVINSVIGGRLEHTAIINWRPGTTTGGLGNTYTYEVSADAGPFVPGTGPLPPFPTIATVDCPGTTICSYRLKATSSKGASPVSNTLSTGFSVATKTNFVTAYVSSLNLGSGVLTVNVTWSLPTSSGGAPVTRYEGRRCNGNCDETAAAWNTATIETLGTTRSWSTTCPAGYATCSYQVRSVNVIGPGPWGSSARIKPFAPTNVVATTAAPAGNVTITWSGPAEGGLGISGYRLYYCITTAGCTNTSHWQNSGLVIGAAAGSVTHNCGIAVQCTYKIAATEVVTGASGSSSSSAAATGSSPASAPQNLTAASGTSIGAVDLDWDPPLDAGTFPVIDYVFQRSVNAGPFSGDISTGSTATTYVDTACGASNFCTYKVAAVTAAGTSPFSNTATAEGANVPSAPLNLNATPGTSFGHVDLTWQPPLDNGGWPVTGYFLERSLDGGTTWPANWTLGTSPSYTDTTCGAGVTCTYRVSAINARGTGPASNLDTAIGTNLSPPQNLTANTSTNTLGGVLLAWDAPASDSGFPILGYEFRFKQDAGAFGAWVSTGTGTGRTFTHVCFTDNVDRLCTYEVRAFNSIGTSSPSNQAAAQGLTDHVSPAPTVVTPAHGSSTSDTTPALSGTAGTALGDATTVTVTIMQGVTVIQTIPGVAVTAGTWSTTAAALANGVFTVDVTQTDWAGNIGTSAANTFTVDTVAPAVTITGPTATVYTRSGRVTTADPSWPCTSPGICGTASDAGSGVNNVKVSVRQGTGNYWDPGTTSFSSAAEILMTATGTTSWNLAFPISNFPAGGSYTARAVGQDNALNSSAGTSVTFHIDYAPSNTVFVAPSGISGNDGLTPATPKPTIAEGLTVSISTGRTVLAIATGSYSGGVTISGATLNNRRLLGGFSTSTWLRAAPNSGGNGTVVNGSGTGVVVSTATGVVIQTLDVLAASTGVVGSSTYGLRADTSASVTIAGVNITAANGVAGTAGTGGTAGADGTTGGFGTNGHDGNCNDGAAGGAGSGSGGTRNGGSGGAGGCGNATGAVGSTGNLTGNGNGGGGGGSGSGSITCGNGNTGTGGSGATTAGAHGTPGGGAGAAVLGTSSLYTPSNGGAGNAGVAGHGGGGGGGGGGHSGGFCSNPDRGGGGGGGGGGGASGSAGTGGQSGGASFGIYSVNSTITLDTSLTFVEVEAGSGGAGGNGGGGAKGGNGGGGGQGGGVHSSATNPASSSGNSCGGCPDGGPGGGGGGGSGAGGGSGGGAGAGGPAIAVYHAGTGTATVNAASLSRVSGGAAGTAGGGGLGGSGGTSGPIPAGGWNTGTSAGGAGTARAGNAASGGSAAAGIICRFHNAGTCVTG